MTTVAMIEIAAITSAAVALVFAAVAVAKARSAISALRSAAAAARSAASAAREAAESAAACADANPHLLAQQLVRHGVVVLLDLDVVVEPELACLPLRIGVGFGRQRLERRPLQFLEQRASARAEMPRHAVVERREECGNGGRCD